MSRERALVAFACGLLTGAAVGTLLAPATGRDTRARVRRGAVAAADRTRMLVRNRRDRVHAFIRRHGVIGFLRHRPEEVVGSGDEVPG